MFQKLTLTLTHSNTSTPCHHVLQFGSMFSVFCGQDTCDIWLQIGAALCSARIISSKASRATVAYSSHVNLTREWIKIFTKDPRKVSQHSSHTSEKCLDLLLCQCWPFASISISSISMSMSLPSYTTNIYEYLSISSSPSLSLSIVKYPLSTINYELFISHSLSL